MISFIGLLKLLIVIGALVSIVSSGWAIDRIRQSKDTKGYVIGMVASLTVAVSYGKIPSWYIEPMLFLGLSLLVLQTYFAWMVIKEGKLHPKPVDNLHENS